MPSTSISVKDALGAIYPVGAEQSGSILTPRSAPEVNGSPVSDSNPLPVVTKGAAGTTIKVVPVPAGVVTKVADAKADRRSLAVVNIGMGLASMGVANTVTTGNGWPLSAAPSVGDLGGGYEWPPQAVHIGTVWVASAVGTTVVVMES